ncbi:hypothetical protein GCM10022247_74040 [Allokutzneria multivorans]|uniref:Uncharacterized protein n=1 Tax=Allokutzneria multivorans TaxID=1142134 RepID=A0ABP7U7R8_9PSEU
MNALNDPFSAFKYLNGPFSALHMARAPGAWAWAYPMRHWLRLAKQMPHWVRRGDLDACADDPRAPVLGEGFASLQDQRTPFAEVFNDGKPSATPK